MTVVANSFEAVATGNHLFFYIQLTGRYTVSASLKIQLSGRLASPNEPLRRLFFAEDWLAKSSCQADAYQVGLLHGSSAVSESSSGGRRALSAVMIRLINIDCLGDTVFCNCLSRYQSVVARIRRKQFEVRVLFRPANEQAPRRNFDGHLYHAHVLRDASVGAQPYLHISGSIVQKSGKADTTLSSSKALRHMSVGPITSRSID
ncbi:hypothetical protein OUZ56_033107 [Daphnia magna]|uniref:Uncharacterized protein n=1 Tax=Daphnia magna TaxID=35525 RepID=A0ABR0BA86_9CRUS|nr:hypothetical protein OUZ56_033107 [Daphnia magna]